MNTAEIRKVLFSKKGEGTYISTVIFILTAVVFIAFIINLFSILNAKQQMDSCADQLTRQIQRAGEVNSNTELLFRSICGRMNAVTDVRYEVDTEYLNGTKIQLGTPFTVKVTAKAYIGGFGDFRLFPVTLTSQFGGVSEEYWK